jgi:lysozyme
MNKITKISQKGLDLIKGFEGFRSKPYLCPAGVPTIGYGSTYYADGKKVTLQDQPISEKEAESLLLETVKTYERCVDSYCTDILSQNQFDALVSFAYNVGCMNLKISTLLKKVNKNVNDPSIRTEFLKWKKSNGKVLYGLVVRREAEAALYFNTNMFKQ